MQVRTKIYDVFISVLLFCAITARAIYQYTKIDGDGRVVTISCLMVLLWGIFSKRKHLREYFNSRPIIYWALLMSYHLLNIFIMRTYDSKQNMPFTIIQELYIMTVVAYLFVNNKKTLFVTLILSLYFYLYTAYKFCSLEETVDRLSLDGFIYTTQLGQLSGFTCVIISLYILLLKKKSYYMCLYVFPCIIAIMTQSRNALWPISFAFFMLFYSYFCQLNVKRIFLYGVFFVLTFQYFQTTAFYERVLTKSEGVSDFWATGTILDSIFDDRALYYLMGYYNFIDNPINGIGLFNFSIYNNFEYMMHPEVLVHIVEGGLIGAGLYFFFNYHLIKNIVKNYSFSNIEQNWIILSFLPLFMVSFTARIFQYTFFFIIYGILIGYTLQRKYLL